MWLIIDVFACGRPDPEQAATGEAVLLLLCSVRKAEHGVQVFQGQKGNLQVSS